MDCIFNARCTEFICDKACPALVETSYLLERNGLSMSNPVFNQPERIIEKTMSILTINKMLKVIIADSTIMMSDMLTFCAICNDWRGNRLRCVVYHLKLSNYIDAIQKSWSAKDMPESLEQEQIWAASAKTLIISSLDYVQFKDFQSQTLLNLIHNRMNNGLDTIVVTPKLQSLIGSGQFFSKMQSVLREAVV